MSNGLKKSLAPVTILNNEYDNIYDYTNFIDVPDIDKTEKLTLLGNGICSEVFLMENIINKTKIC